MSEFFASELALVLNRGRGTANHLHHRAVVWRDNLPATFAALSAGELDLARAAALADVLGATTPALAQAVEKILLPEATDLSVAKLRNRALELLAELDAAAVDERRQEAERHADVFLQPGPDGRATLGADLDADEAVEAYAVLDELAKMAKADGDERPIGQIRAELFSLLLRRPGGHGQPGVAAHLTITATLDSLAGVSVAAGSVNGLAITAAHVRELLARIGALGLTCPDGGSLAFAITDDDRAAAGHHHRRRAAAAGEDGLPRASRRRLRVPGPRRATRPGRLLSPPAGRKPFVTTRDRTCRMPNCGQRVGLGRPGPRHSALLRRPDLLHQSLLPVPHRPPAEDLRPRLAVRHGPRRHPARHHTLRRHPHHPTTRPAPAPTRTAAPRTGRRPTTLLTVVRASAAA